MTTTTDAPSASRSRQVARLLTGATALQAFGSLSTMAHIIVLARLLPSTQFDAYSVWVTAGGFILGVAQAVGAERVLVGRRAEQDGLAVAAVLGLTVGGVLAILSLVLGAPTLLWCALAVPPTVAWDYLRVVEGLPKPAPFLRRDISVAFTQLAGVGVAAALGAPAWTLPVVYWFVAGGMVSIFMARRVRALFRFPVGLRLLWTDRAQAFPLVFDGVLAGLPLVVGLGNPGRQYESTRHNLGWIVLDALASKHALEWQPAPQFEAEIARWATPHGTRWLLKPLTFMNSSGTSVQRFARFHRLTAEEIAVAYDDLTLELGAVKVSVSGSAGGHNGVDSLIRHLGPGFVRYRLGIGPKRPVEMDLADFVLARFTPEQLVLLSEKTEAHVQGLELLLTRGLEAAMNQLNRREPK